MDRWDEGREKERLYDIFVDIRDLLWDIRNAIAGISPERISIKPEDWVEKSSSEDVEILPNETKTVLRVTDSGYLWEVGVNDETYSTYYLYIDGKLVGEPQPQPWGLYNSPYRFPKPIEFGSSVEVKIYRHSDAPASATYYAKVRYEKRY